jgi:hypothetical protein
MKDKVDKLFQDRFSGHEMPVDPALWAAIEGQLLVSAATTDPVNELFKERFQGHELPVDPAVWDGIGRQLGHTPAPPASTTAWTWAASAAAVVVVGAGLWWGTAENAAPVAEQRTAPSTVVEAPAELPGGPTPSEADGSAAAPAQVPVARPTAITTALPAAARSNAGAPQPSVSDQQNFLHVDEEGSTSPSLPPAPIAATPTPMMGGQPVSASPAPAADPQRVEAIIQEITERTLIEARANPAPTAPPPPAADPETSMAEVPELFMPNTFTPNGDGVNDTYELSMEGFERMSIRVLSLKNDKLVFSTTTGEPWTGAGCEDGMYVVVVEAVAEDGRSLSKGKVVWLTRERMN